MKEKKNQKSEGKLQDKDKKVEVREKSKTVIVFHNGRERRNI